MDNEAPAGSYNNWRCIPSDLGIYRPHASISVINTKPFSVIYAPQDSYWYICQLTSMTTTTTDVQMEIKTEIQTSESCASF